MLKDQYSSFVKTFALYFIVNIAASSKEREFNSADVPISVGDLPSLLLGMLTEMRLLKMVRTKKPNSKNPTQKTHKKTTVKKNSLKWVFWVFQFFDEKKHVMVYKTLEDRPRLSSCILNNE